MVMQSAVSAQVRRKRAVKKYLFVASFLIVPLFLLLAFTIIPLFGVGVMSFFYWDGIATPEWIGMDNFVRIFRRQEYWRALLNSGYYLVGSIVQIVIAMFFAALLTFTTRFKNLFKGFIFFPYLINGVAAGYMFYLFFQPEIGTLNGLIRLFGGMGAETYLADQRINNTLLAAVSLWRYMGLNFIMFLGVIASVDKSLYEAAELDGANKWQIFRFIIFPSIMLVVLLNMILAVRGALSVFEVPFIVTDGAFGTSTFVIEAYRVSFSLRPDVGLGSAMSTLLLIIVLIATVVQRLIFREEKV